MIVIYFFQKLVDKKNDKVKFDIIPKINEEYISVKHGCIIIIDRYRFLLSSLDSLAKTVVDISLKTLKHFEKGSVDIVGILNTVNELKILIREGLNNKDSIKKLKKDCPDNIKRLEEVLLEYMGE